MARFGADMMQYRQVLLVVLASQKMQDGQLLLWNAKVIKRNDIVRWSKNTSGQYSMSSDWMSWPLADVLQYQLANLGPKRN